ncbi:MAG TPA: hypothetical protein VGR48_08345 [Terriglobales bacterium]|nr:hypothetical protein [Terriglobales bacterium]
MTGTVYPFGIWIALLIVLPASAADNQGMRAFVSGRVLLGFVALTLFAATALASKDYRAPEIKPALTYPAHEEHANEHVAIAVEPYETAEKQKIFSVDFHQHGLLPVLLVITNDGDEPISLTDMQIQLITGARDKIMPASSNDIYRRLANPQVNDRPTVPVPIPRRKVKGTVSAKTMDEIESAQFAAKAVEPRNTRAGFLFFDVEGIRSLAGAHILFTRLHNGQGDDLMFFEIPLDKYFGAAGAASR